MKQVKQTKSDRTRAAILVAAQQLFAEHGYDGTTVRDVAARASIDPAMVIRYFGNKDELFAQAAHIELSLPDLRTVEPGAVGKVLIRHFLGIWEGAASGKGMAILLRSATSNEYAAIKTREAFAAQVRPAIATLGGTANASSRAGLVASQLLGLALCRYVLKLPPVVALSHDEIIDNIGPTLQRYATGTDG
jgi:AcrR family transcriptional regulator